MLEYLRNAAEKPVGKFIMGLLIFAFVGWGAASWLFDTDDSRNGTTLMTVGDTEISRVQYENVKSAEMANKTRAEQRAIYTNPAKSAEFRDDIIKKISTQAMIDNHAQTLGYLVSDHGVINKIRNTAEFQQDGQYSPILFQILIQRAGYDEATFAAMVREQILHSMVLSPIEKKITVPTFVANTMYNARYGERTIDYATVKFSDFNAGNPTDEQLREFYAQNPRKIAETRDISYVLIPANMEEPDKYEIGLEAAKKLEDDIVAGEKMSDIYKKHNAKYAHYEKISGENLPTDKNINEDKVLREIFSLDENTDSAQIETKNGFMIVHIDKITPEHNAEFESVKNSLVNDWRKAEQKKQAYVRANELLVDLNKNGKLAGKKTAKVSRTSGAPIDVLVATFNNPIKNNSIVSGQNEFYVLHIDNEKTPAVDAKKMQNIKTEVNNMAQRHIQDDFNSFLLREYPVEINKKTLESITTKLAN